jgi:hypothetical protein
MNQLGRKNEGSQIAGSKVDSRSTSRRHLVNKQLNSEDAPNSGMLTLLYFPNAILDGNSMGS